MPDMSPLARDVILRLRLDPTQVKEGWAQAKQIQQQAQAEMLSLKAQEIRARGELESSFTAQYVRELRAQVAATTEGSAQKRAAAVQELASYQELTEKIRALRLAMVDQQVTAKEAQIASAAFRQTGGAGGWETYGNERVLSGFTAAGAMQAVGLGSLTMGIPMALSAIASAFKDAAFGGTEFGHSLDLISQKTGRSMTDLQTLGAIGKTVGLDLNDMVIATRMFSKAIVGGEGGVDGFEGANTRGSKALAALGIATRDAQGNMRDMNSIMDEVAEKFKQAPDGPEKAAIAVTLFGRSGLNLIPYLNQGKEGLAAMRDEFGPFVTDLNAAAKAQQDWLVATAKFSMAMVDLKSSMSGVVEILAKLTEGLATYLGESVRVSNQVQDFAKAAGMKGTLTPAGTSMMKTLLNPAISEEPEVGMQLTSARTSLAGRGIQKPTDEGVAYEAVRMKNEQLLSEGKINELLIQETVAAKDTNEEFKKAALLAAGGKDATESEGKAIADNIDKLNRELLAFTALNEARKASLGVRAGETPGQVTAQENSAKVSELATLSIQAGPEGKRKLAGQELLDNIQKQLDLTKELNQLEIGRENTALGLARLQREQQITAELQAQLTELDKIMQQAAAAIPAELLARTKGPNAVRAGFGTVQGQFETTSAQIETKAITPEAGLDKLKQEHDILQQNIAAGLQQLSGLQEGTIAYSQQLELLKQMLELDAKITEETKKTAKMTPGGELLDYFNEVGNIIGKFSPALNKMFSEIAAGSKLLATSLKDMGATPGKPGSILDSLKGIFSKDGETRIKDIMGALGAIGGIATVVTGISQATGAVSGALGGALGGAEIGTMILPGIGTAVGAIGGAVFGGLTGAKRAQSAALTKQITDSFKDISEAFNSGTVSLADTITQLTALQAKATASIKTGKKGNQTQMQAEIDAITSQIDQLKKQQKSVLDAFNQQIGIFALPTGAQDIASKIVAIAQALKTAADAGATAAQQIAYLNGAMAALQKTTAEGLQTDQQDTLNMMKQSLDLKQQVEDLNTNYNDAVLNVRRSLGLAPALTPEQQAAKQLLDLKKQHDQQLASLTEQQDTLQAELNGRMELFGWTQKDLDATTARATIVSQQLAIERSITAETIARIQAQEAYLSQMAAGKIPTLPTGTLPAGFTWPTGATYNQTITISFPSMPSNPADFAKIVSEGLKQLNRMGQVGLQ